MAVQYDNVKPALAILPLRELDLGLGCRQRRAELVRHVAIDLHDVAALLVDRLVDDPTVIMVMSPTNAGPRYCEFEWTIWPHSLAQPAR
jgi:hypothetical protein